MAYSKTNGTTGSRAAPGSQNQRAVRGPPMVQHTFPTLPPLPRASNLNAGVYQTAQTPTTSSAAAGAPKAYGG
jgi:hypothetical protein